MTKIDKTSLFVALLGPVFWIIDSLFNSFLLNESFFRQLIFCKPSEFLLRFWLVFFFFIQAWFLSRYSLVKNRHSEIEGKFNSLFDLVQDKLVIIDTEGKVREILGSTEIFWGYSKNELLGLQLTQLAAEKESERVINFIREIIRKKQSVLDNVMFSAKGNLTVTVNFQGKLIDDPRFENKQGIALGITEVKLHQEQPCSVQLSSEELRVKLEQERKQIEETIRQEENKKYQETIKTLEQKYLETLRQRLAEECKKTEESVRQEERKKFQEQIPMAEGKDSDAIALKIKQECARVEESVRQEETKKAQEAQKVLEQKYTEILWARVAEARKQAEELARQEEHKNVQEQIRELEFKFSEEVGIKVAEGRKLIEESVRLEEQIKTREEIAALEVKYAQESSVKSAQELQEARELIRQEEVKKVQEQIAALEAKHAEESSVKVAQELKQVEARIRQEENEKFQEDIKALKHKYQEMLRVRLDEECKKTEAIVRQEEAEKNRQTKKTLEQEFAETLKTRLVEECKQAEELARQEEKKKTQEQIAALEIRFAEESSVKLAQECKQVEETIRQEENKKSQEAIKALEQKYQEMLQSRIAEECIKAEEAIRKEEIKNTQEQIAALEAKFSAAAVEKEIKIPEINRLVSGVGQQFMNPLSAVLNNVKLAKIKMMQGGELKIDDFKETINFIEENALLCRNILSSLADPARASKGIFQPISLNNVIAKIDNLIGQELRLQNIAVQKLLKADLPEINGDSLLLTQAVFNLIVNAKWAIKNNLQSQSGTITIKTQSGPQDDFVELSISDNGIGIPNQNLARVFEPFFTTKPDSLGLGLTIAYNIIKEHQGEIKVESQEATGTIFRIILPAIK